MECICWGGVDTRDDRPFTPSVFCPFTYAYDAGLCTCICVLCKIIIIIIITSKQSINHSFIQSREMLS